MTTALYGISDVAAHLSVSKATVCNWRIRHPESVPQPEFIVPGKGRSSNGGAPYWSAKGLDDWLEWQTGRSHREAKRIEAQIDRLLKRLEGL